MRRELTDAYLRGLTPPATGRLEIWDVRVSGLMLRVTPSGAASWSVRARTSDGKRTRPTLGTWPAMGIAAARKQGRAVVAAIQAGGDPVAAQRATRKARAARASLPTAGERLDEWQRDRVGDWSERYAAEVRRIVKSDVGPAVGRRALVETTRADWTGIVAAKRRVAPAMASGLYRVCASFLGHAEARGWIAEPMLPRKGLAAIAPAPPSRARVLTDGEMRRVWIAAGELAPKGRAFARLLVMTAARELEVADIATGEIDFGSGRWAIPAERTKNRRGIVLPLHPLLIEELRAVWPAHGEAAGQNWRLLGAIAGSGLRGFSKLKTRLDKVSGVTGWRWHDLRRTARTGMTRLGVARDHAEAALNHISGRSALERTYDRHDYAEEVLAALSRWQSHVAALVSDMPSAAIVPIRKAG